MRYTDEQTERAIAVLTAVIRDAGKPLPVPEEVRAMETEGREADALSARLRMIYPTIPADSEQSVRAQFWRLILDGNYEGIEIVRTLDYDHAWEDTDGGARHPALGSYYERWYSSRLKNGLTSLICGL